MLKNLTYCTSNFIQTTTVNDIGIQFDGIVKKLYIGMCIEIILHCHYN